MTRKETNRDNAVCGRIPIDGMKTKSEIDSSTEKVQLSHPGGR